MAKEALTFRPVGQFGVEIAEEGGFAILRIPTDPKAARPSQSGKMNLTASTGGWITAGAIKLNVMAGVSAAKA